MTVYFIGAGPGAPDLLTQRAARLVARCGTSLYAGNVVPRDVLSLTPPTARIVDTAGLPFDAVIEEIRTAHGRGDDVARLHSGDPGFYSSLDRQVRALDADGIPWEIVPGVPTFAAANAALGQELTAPGNGQSVVLTRIGDGPEEPPRGEELATVCASGATAVIHLTVAHLDRVVTELSPIYGADCPTAIVAYATRPEEVIVRGRLADIASLAVEAEITRAAVLIVGSALGRDRTPDRAEPVGTSEPPGRILILGGTSEGRHLADRLHSAGLDVVTSLAGQVARPRLPKGEVRVGGFGGLAGMTRWIRENDVSAVIDATHPFAEKISDSALRATEDTGVPLLRVHRRPWEPRPGDDWIRVASLAEAATVVRDRFSRPMLTIGRLGLEEFSEDSRASYLIRCVEPPDGPLPDNYLLVLDRGPFSDDSERALISRHRIDVLVTKNSGGSETAAKLTAARELRIPVIVIDRPPAPQVDTVHSVDEAARWFVRRFGRGDS